METWYNISQEAIVVEPESAFEFSLLNDLLADNDGLTCTTVLSEVDKSVVGIIIKPFKTQANTEDALTKEDIDEMYTEMEAEDVGK